MDFSKRTSCCAFRMFMHLLSSTTILAFVSTYTAYEYLSTPRGRGVCVTMVEREEQKLTSYAINRPLPR